MERPRFSFKTIVVEFLVVVFGVAVALLADNWRQDLADRSTEREYLRRLHTELRTARSGIAVNQLRTVSAIAAIDTILADWHNSMPKDDAHALLLALRAADYELNPAGIVYDLTYRELLATGSLSLIRNPQLRMGITDYYRLAYRTADVIAAGDDPELRRYVNRIRSATGTSIIPDSADAISPKLRSRVILIFSDLESQEGELLYLRSRLHGRMRWLDRLLAGTDSVVAQMEHLLPRL